MFSNNIFQYIKYKNSLETKRTKMKNKNNLKLPLAMNSQLLVFYCSLVLELEDKHQL